MKQSSTFTKVRTIHLVGESQPLLERLWALQDTDVWAMVEPVLGPVLRGSFAYTVNPTTCQHPKMVLQYVTTTPTQVTRWLQCADCGTLEEWQATAPTDSKVLTAAQ